MKKQVISAIFIFCLSAGLCTAKTQAQATPAATENFNYEQPSDDEQAIFKKKIQETPLICPGLQKGKKGIDLQTIKPNEAGQIMVLMYHGLDPYKQSASYMRTIQGFKDDLQKLYDNGYRPIPVADYINNNIQVEAGYTPVVITFDDAMSTAFSLEEKDGKLVPAKDCAVDIMDKFAEAHPDFGKAAVFFLNVDGRPPFFGAGTLTDRFKYLADNGYELGNHTASHPELGGLSAKQIQKEMALVEKMVQEALPGYQMQCMAYPYGERPRKGLIKYALEGEYDNVRYNYKMAFRAANSGASSTPNNTGFDKHNAPRVRGTDTATMDLGWYVRHFKDHPELRYISDGDPMTITVPSTCTQYLDTSTFDGRVLNVYDPAQKEVKRH